MKNKNTCFFVLIFFVLINISNAQTQIKGLVVDFETQEPIELANVFIANTMIGTTSDQEGNFVLKNISLENVNLIVSYVGYKSFARDLVLLENQTVEIRIELSPILLDISEVTVKAKSSNKRKRYLEQFKNTFLGSSENAKQCTILNPKDILFKELKGGGYEALANEMIEIENKALGYKVKFLLGKYEQIGLDAMYHGKTFFEELIPSSEEEIAQWENKRKHTYLGSKRHFLKSLYHNKIEEEGFVMDFAIQKGNGDFEKQASASSEDVIKLITKKEVRVLAFEHFLQITYLREKDKLNATQSYADAGAIGSSSGNGLGILQQKIRKSKSKNKKEFQTSLISCAIPHVPFDKNGLIRHPQSLIEYGYWTLEGMADLLPFEYRLEAPKYIANPYAQKKPAKRQVNRNNMSILPIHILDGGIERDGIEAINNPVFHPAKNTLFVKPEDQVIGVVYNGIAKAYPLDIMEYHEIINDQYKDQFLLIHYNPLIGMARCFKAKRNGKRLTFGGTGYIYNNDLLIYDQQTESLWSPMLQKGISGSFSDVALPSVKTLITTFEQWKKQFPESLVMIPDKNKISKYKTRKYPLYEKSNHLLFPVNSSDHRLPLKEKVLGLVYKDVHKAYPFFSLKNGLVQDEIKGEKIFIKFDQASGAATVEDAKGNELLSDVMYWFAWYAFHPNTSVFEQGLK